jgi:hypothetical protein
VTVFPGEGPFIINDHLSREAPQLVASLGWSAAGVWNHKSFPLYGHTLWVIGPEHAKTIGDAGWTKQDVKRHLFETVRRRARELEPGPDGAESGRLKNLGASDPDALVPKFPSAEEIMVDRGRRHGRPFLGRRCRAGWAARSGPIPSPG